MRGFVSVFALHATIYMFCFFCFLLLCYIKYFAFHFNLIITSLYSELHANSWLRRRLCCNFYDHWVLLFSVILHIFAFHFNLFFTFLCLRCSEVMCGFVSFALPATIIFFLFYVIFNILPFSSTNESILHIFVFCVAC